MPLDFSQYGSPEDSQSANLDFSSFGTPEEEKKSPKGDLAESAKMAASDFAQAADMIASIPGFVAKVGTTGLMDIINAVRGTDKPIETASKMVEDATKMGFNKFISTPVDSILESAGISLPKEGTVFNDVMSGISKGVEKGANKVESSTGSSELGAAAKQLVDVGMLSLGALGAKKFTENRLPTENVDDILKNIKEEKASTTTPSETGPIDYTPPETSLVPKTPYDIGGMPEIQTGAELPKYEGGINYDFGGLDTAKQTELPLTQNLPEVTSDLKLIPKGKETDLRFKGNEYLKPKELPAAPVAPEVEISPVQKTLFQKQEPVDNTGISVQELPFNPEDWKKQSTLENNASGESAASMEAINRLKSQNESGIKQYLYHPETGNITPLVTADRVDTSAPKGQAKIEVSPEGKVTVLDNNSSFGNTPLKNRAEYELGKQEPLGQSGFGKGQRGSIGFKTEPPSLEKLSTKLTKDEWMQEFAKRYPNDIQLGDEVWNRLNLAKELKDSKSFGSKVQENLDKPDYALGLISTRLGNIAPRIKQVALNFERNNMVNISERLKNVDPFLEAINKTGLDKEVVKHDILNGRYDAVRTKIPEFDSKLGKVRTVLDKLGEDLKHYGIVDNLRQNYFPRIVSDYEGMMKYLGKTEPDLVRMINAAELKAKANGVILDDVTRSSIINDYLKKREYGQGGLGYKKSRTIDQIPPDLVKFYSNPTQSLHSYIRSATFQIEAAKFFGKALSKDPVTKKIDIATTIGKYTDNLLAEGKLKPKDIPKIKELLQARFGPGQYAANVYVQTYKDLNNLTLLNDVSNTVMQAADIAPVLVMDGIRPTLQSTFYQLLGKNKYNIRDLGIIDHVAEEFAGEKWTTQKVHKLFRGIGFTQLDAFVKNVAVNAHRFAREAEIGNPNSRLYKVYGPQFAEEFPQLLNDLKSGKRTELTDQLLFSELSAHQPITKLERTQFALENPNFGGVVMNLKTFMLKQADFVRNEIYNEIKRGDVKTAAKQAALYALYSSTITGGIQAFKNWLTNQPQDTWQEIAWALPRMFNVNQYFSDKIQQGKVVEAVAGSVIPPWKQYQDIAEETVGLKNMAENKLLGEDIMNPRKEATGKILKYVVPGVGDELYYNFTEEGKARRQKAEDKNLMESLK